MHDFSLGGPVDVGEYTGPLLEGEPLHGGSCEDGVYGCRACNRAASTLTDEQLESIGWPTTCRCDWCKKDVKVAEISGVRPWDEPDCYYEICKSCRKSYDDELRREFSVDRCDWCNGEYGKCGCF